MWDPRIVKPLDQELLRDAARHRFVVTVEDGIVVGGIGSQIAEGVAALDESRESPPFSVLGTPAQFLAHGKPDRILADLGLDGAGIAASVTKALVAGRVILD